ncbi:hypothetical protein LEP1GSC172_3010 [Leptospira noguchii]|uniref:Uncharacterized protein n=2 Tax=Leptospira noguchii TaxID=28182 RepID=T0FWC5_9LEPT|nr:hypothetical protein LEP1GSC172_3010 [Leptospira noguchii]EQA73870.1 hypothetical protein LEP1GSC059_3960 [Leptospira noguchii serovar Panama str. CZ214]
MNHKKVFLKELEIKNRVIEKFYVQFNKIASIDRFYQR